MSVVKKPIDLVALSLEEQVIVKCRGERELRGKLYAFDQHLNMVLGDVEETIQEENSNGEIIVRKRTRELLFIRGDSVIIVSPPVSTY